MLKTWLGGLAHGTRLSFDTVCTAEDDAAAEAARQAAAAAAGGGAGKPFKVYMTEADFQADQNAAEARARAMAERRGLSPEEKVELERLRNETREAERKKAEDKGQYDAALTSVKQEHAAKETSWQKRERELLDELQQDRCTGRIIAASSGKAVNPNQLSKLLVAEGRIKLDDHNKPVVLDEEGKPWFVSGRAATVEELVDGYLKANKHLALPGAAGTGASGGSAAGDAGGGAGEGDEAQIKALEGEYKTAFEEARKSNNPSDMSKAHLLKVKIDRLKAESKTKK